MSRIAALVKLKREIVEELKTVRDVLTDEGCVLSPSKLTELRMLIEMKRQDLLFLNMEIDIAVLADQQQAKSLRG